MSTHSIKGRIAPARDWRSPAVLLVRISVAALVLFHGYLLARRLVSLTLFEPWVALRWAGTAALLAALWRLRSRRMSLLTGRRALVFWLLVAVLHAPAVVPAAGEHPVAGPDATWLGFAVPLTLGVTAGCRWLAGRAAGRRPGGAVLSAALELALPAVAPLSYRGFATPALPRPPPV